MTLGTPVGPGTLNSTTWFVRVKPAAADTIGRSAAARDATTACAAASRARASARRWLASTASDCASSSDSRNVGGSCAAAPPGTASTTARSTNDSRSGTARLLGLVYRSALAARRRGQPGDEHVFERRPAPGHLLAQARGIARVEDASLVKQGDVRAALCFVHVGRRHEDGDAVGEELREQLPEFAARHGVNTGRRLVEQNQLGLVHQRAGQRQLLLHATGKPIRQTVAERCELRHLEEPVAAGLVIRDAVNLGKERHVLVDGEIAVQAEAS